MAYKDIVTLKTIDYNKLKVNDVYKDDRKIVAVNGDEIIVNSISNRFQSCNCRWFNWSKRRL